jgi:putative ABC transport system permease protein
MRTLIQDVRSAIRMLTKTPGFTAVVVLTLALGIGANTAIFSVIEAVLLRSLPFGGAARVFRIERSYDRVSWHVALGSEHHSLPYLSYPDIEDIVAQAHSFEATAIVTFATDMTLTGSGEARNISAQEVSPSFFSVLDFQPQLGRAFTVHEADAQERVVVLTHELWQTQFGGNPDIVGQSIQLNHHGYRVVGILPPHLSLLLRNTDVLLPFSMQQVPLGRRSSRALHGPNLYARLRPTVSEKAAATEVNVIAARLRQQYPDTDKDQDYELASLREVISGSVRPALLMLMGAVALVLLIACANVSNMFLARATGRHREMAIRAALGASRTQIGRQLFVESLIVASLGAAAGLLLARMALSLLISVAPSDLPSISRIDLNLPVLAFTIVATVIAALLSGFLPTFRVSASHPATLLSERSSTGRRETARARTVLIVSEMALAFVLLTTAGLLLKSFAHLYIQDPGFNTTGVLTFWLSLDPKYQNAQNATQLLNTVSDDLLSIPGVQSSGMTTDLVLERGADTYFSIAGRPQPTAIKDQPDALFRATTPGYLDSMGLRLVAGRLFKRSDTASAQLVAVINESLARRYFPGQNPLGQHVQADTSPFDLSRHDAGDREIIGVVSDARTVSLRLSDQPTMYIPCAQVPPGWGSEDFETLGFAVRTERDPALAQSAILATVRRDAPEMAISEVHTIRELISTHLAPQRFNFLLLAVFAGMGIFLATIGIYGVMAYAVAQRRPEVGVRLALGAQRHDIIQMIVGNGMKLALVGLALGVAGAIAISGILQQFVYGMSATDPAMLAGVTALFLFVALVANVVPSLPALAVDPIEVLRSE